MRFRWPVLSVLITVLFAAAGATGASVATSSVTEIAEALRGNPVYVDAEAERALDDTEAEDLRAAIRDQGEAIFVAVLPSSMGATPEDADQLVREIVEASGL